MQKKKAAMKEVFFFLPAFASNASRFGGCPVVGFVEASLILGYKGGILGILFKERQASPLEVTYLSRGLLI